MNVYLFKTEPTQYSFDALVKDGTCVWDGVSNAAALQAMRRMKKGDLVFVYHTGDEKAVVGLARVVRGAYADPSRPGMTAAGEPRHVLVEIEPVKAAKAPMSLAQIKAIEAMEDFALVRQSRLSVMDVPPGPAKIIRAATGL